MSLFLETVRDTELLGAYLATQLRAGDVLLLSGDLGVGKTSLCRGLLRQLTHNKALETPSPSYLISFTYESPNGLKAHHIDPYRLTVGAVAKLIDFDIAARNDLLLIEWPERLGAELEKEIQDKAAGAIIRLKFNGTGPQARGRQISVSLLKETDHWLSMLSTISTVDFTKLELLSETTATTAAEAAPTRHSPEHLPADALVLGIESSCDDTACAILTADGRVVAEVIASQSAIHSEWGGVAHAAAIDATIDGVLAKAGITAADLAAVAVTVGPGLSLCLQVGVKKATEIASAHSIPLVKVHHMEAHMLVTRLPNQASPIPEFPFVTALVSGGHSLLVLTRGLGDHTLLGGSLDDSAGEAFDKVARLLGINHVPGGPHLEQMALAGNLKCLDKPLPKPLSHTRDDSLRTNCDFSFAGLKTAVRDRIAAGNKPEDIAAAFQERVGTHLTERADRAIRWAKEVHPEIKHLVVAGGVAANKRIRAMFTQVAETNELIICLPKLSLCSDNGVMVAWTGIERLRQGLYDTPPAVSQAEVEKFVEVRPRWPLGPKDDRSIGKIRVEDGGAPKRKKTT
jgi:N6-L-threonylcarbamoyladenine synthase